MNFLTIFKTFLLTLLNECFVHGVYNTCPTNKNTWEFGNSCVQVHFNELDWDDARAYCRRLGGDLLGVRSKEMQSFLQSHLIGTGRKPAGYWIGATDRHHEDNWQWVHGDKSMHFSNWEKGQGPGQSGFFFSDGSLEDCAMIRPDAGYKWHDGPCAGGFAFHYAFLCEFQIVRISAATTKPTLKPTASILMSTLKPTTDLKASSSKNPSTTVVFTQPPFPTDSSKPSKSIRSTASSTSVVTPKPTKSITTKESTTSVVTPKPTKSITTRASTTSVVTPKPTKSISTRASTTSVVTPKPTKSITTRASTTSVVTSPTTTSSSPLPTVTSLPSSPVTSTEVPTSTAMPTTTTTATGVIIGG